MQSESASLLGRGEELAALGRAVEAARQGRGSFTLLSGEPGIGKSALARAFAERAADEGLIVAWGRAWEAGGAPPFWPWIEVLRQCLRARGEQPLPDVPNLGALLGLVPELGQRDPRLTPLPALDPASMRFQIGDAVAAFLFRAAHDRPLAIVLEDLHAADRPSLEALRFVASRLTGAPLALIATYRDAEARLSHETHQLLERAARAADRLPLARLDRAAVLELATRSGAPSDASFIDAIAARTEGNPLFVIETLRL
ncbi:MAG: AAA family ATPase [Myxococcota bacterium]